MEGEKLTDQEQLILTKWRELQTGIRDETLKLHKLLSDSSLEYASAIRLASERTDSCNHQALEDLANGHLSYCKALDEQARVLSALEHRARRILKDLCIGDGVVSSPVEPDATTKAQVADLQKSLSPNLQQHKKED